MKKTIGWISRALLLGCAAGLVTVLFVPLWRIDLVAPQYPEGLSLLIHPNRLAGNVDIINGLNHYIGMKTLHTEDFAEFTVLPYLIIFYAALFLLAALIGKRRLLQIVFLLFLLFGIVAMIDFWRWEYHYGHDLNEDAAIKVPGMSYDPPLIGYKQLLNFSAYSIPDTGGWIFIVVGVLALGCVVLEWKKNRKKRSAYSALAGWFLLLVVFTLAGCKSGPEPIVIGKDPCSFCKMTISDPRFGAEWVSSRGKLFKFDDVHCLLAYRRNSPDSADKGSLYFVDFFGDHRLLPQKQSLFYQSEALHSPMGGNIAACAVEDSLKLLAQQFPGKKISWSELNLP